MEIVVFKHEKFSKHKKVPASSEAGTFLCLKHSVFKPERSDTFLLK